MTSDLATTAATARTLLFVPGDRPERFAKAAAAGPDLVLLDLEDAVAPDAKATARTQVVAALRDGFVAGVRINAVGTPWHDDDLAALDGLSCLVMVPKAEDPTDVAPIGARWPVVALVETARGVLQAAALADVAGVVRLAFGSFDLAAELGVSPDDRDAMAPSRGALVLASAAAGIAQPVDGVTGDVGDLDALADDVRFARRTGFGAKLCIHPGQVSVAEDHLRASDDELGWAQGILAAVEGAAGGVVTVDGRMVDKPVIERARRLLAAGGAR